MNPRRRCGLSMIELTLVILVIGLLAAVAAPRFAESLRVTQLEAAAQQMAAHIRYLRNVAINEGRTVTLVCDNVNETYQCDTVDFPERIGESIFVSLPDDVEPTFKLHANFDSATSMSFDFEGVPHVGGTAMSNGRVTLRSGDYRFRVSIDAGTGVVTVTRVEPKTVDPVEDTLDAMTAESSP